jgi:hypothetical protein
MAAKLRLLQLLPKSSLQSDSAGISLQRGEPRLVNYCVLAGSWQRKKVVQNLSKFSTSCRGIKK